MNLRKLALCILVLLLSDGYHPGALTPLQATAQSSGVKVSGRLFNVEGVPYDEPGARAVLSIANGVAGVSKIGPGGNFEFTRIAPGNYSLCLIGTSVQFSPVLPVRVANTDIVNLEMVGFRAKQITGQVAVDGAGPLPVIRFQLKPLNDPTANPAVRALSPSGFVTGDTFNALLPYTPMLALSPIKDGAVFLRLPDGDWNLSLNEKLPAGYSIKTLTYGSVDILRNPLKVRLSDNATLRFVVTNSVSGLTRVNGRITGLTPELIARGKMSVSLRGPMTPGPPVAINTVPRTATVGADGSFEIDDVLPGDYSAMVTGFDTLALAVARLSVGKAEVRDFEIEIHRTEIHGQVFIEGGGPMIPSLTLSFRTVQESGIVGGGNVLGAKIEPLPDGTFTAVLPELEQLANTGYSGACGYKLKSMIYGATDVLRVPLKVLKADASQLQITLTYSECIRR